MPTKKKLPEEQTTMKASQIVAATKAYLEYLYGDMADVTTADIMRYLETLKDRKSSVPVVVAEETLTHPVELLITKLAAGECFQYLGSSPTSVYMFLRTDNAAGNWTCVSLKTGKVYVSGNTNTTVRLVPVTVTAIVPPTKPYPPKPKKKKRYSVPQLRHHDQDAR